MKTRIISTLPKNWSSHPKAKGVIVESDISVYGSRVKAKLLIFDKKTSLHNFWKKVLHKGHLGNDCLGAVNSLRVEMVNLETCEVDEVEVDKNYFCVIGLVKGHLTMEIITHESVHAGFCYHQRLGKRNRFREEFEDDCENMQLQECVAYPTGAIAHGITKVCRKHKLI